jgi:hypothetical protein
LKEEFVTIKCKDCPEEMVVPKTKANKKRCDKCNKIHSKTYQREYRKTYDKVYRGVLANKPVRRKYLKKKAESIDEVEYCKQNWNSVEGCLNCPIKECLQPIDNDSFLPWEDEGFYEDDYEDLNRR